MAKTWRNDAAYVAKREALARYAQKHDLPCWLCLKPINWQAHWKAKDSFTADHIKPIANGGKMTGELKPAHRSCNSRRGAREHITTLVKQHTTTRDWL